MSDWTDDRALGHLPVAAARLGGLFGRPRVIAGGCVVVLAGLGWLYLGLVAGESLAQGGGLTAALRSLCGPLAGRSSFGMPEAGAGSLSDFLVIAAMWGAMSLAMMLPSAGPMILTYAEIADTAARKRMWVVSPFVLALGYATIWLGFALIAAAMQIVMIRLALVDSAMAPAGAALSASLFILAGLYQFSALKQSCLHACQRPFPFFFANWRTTARGVFVLGLRQGLHCLGCCWAMMLLMFAVGVMNVVWMATLAIVMTAEKMSSTRRLSHAIGIVLIVIGVASFGAQGFALWSSN